MSKYYQFSENEDQYIKANYLKISLSQIAKNLNISPYVIKRRYRDLELVVPLEIKHEFSVKAMGVTLVKFTADEDLFIKENYHKIPTKRLASIIGKKYGSVRKRIDFLGLNLTAEMIQNFKEQSWLKKGSIPPNKGKKIPEHVKAKMQRTMFKKGNVPHNLVPIGTERITKDGYVEIKIYDGKGNDNWDLKHRVIWRQHFGEIPHNHNVQFKDGNRQNTAISNLYLITKQENLHKHLWTANALAKRYLRLTDDELSYMQRKNPELLQMVELHYNLKREINQKQS